MKYFSNIPTAETVYSVRETCSIDDSVIQEWIFKQHLKAAQMQLLLLQEGKHVEMTELHIITDVKIQGYGDDTNAQKE